MGLCSACGRYGKLDDIAWYEKNSDGKIHPVGKKQPNAFGFYDMLGNVYEWCHDRYAVYPLDPQTDPSGPNSGRYRVARGGSFDVVTGFVRATFRRPGVPSFGFGDHGFRLARSAP